jgi:predicted phage terminase large subunit-like protein
MVRMLSGYDARAIPQTVSKEIRATGLSAQQQAGNVLLVRGDWNQRFIVECAAFPEGTHDDQVDAVASAFNRLVGAETIGDVRPVRDLRLRGQR